MSLMRNCRDVAQLLSKAQDQPLTRRERLEVWMHQRFCRYCRQYERHLRRIHEALLKRRGALALTAAGRARIAAALRRLRGSPR